MLDERTIDRVLEVVHWGDQWREGGNHPNSSVGKCGTCDRIRLSVYDESYRPNAPFEGSFDDPD